MIFNRNRFSVVFRLSLLVALLSGVPAVAFASAPVPAPAPEINGSCPQADLEKRIDRNDEEAQDGTASEYSGFDRGLGRNKSFVFVPKGTVMAGLSVSYANYDFNNYKFLMIDGLTLSGTTFGIAPHVSYFVRDNLSVGARFDYDTYNLGMGGASIDLSDDLGFDISDFTMINRSYTASITMRNYFPIGDSKRFGFFTEVRLSGGYGQSKNYKQVAEDKYGTYQEMAQLGLGLTPGVVFFVTNETALEVSVGVLGFDYKRVTQYTNQVYEGTYEKSGANFKINILNINFGLTFYIPTAVSRGRK